MPMSSATAGHQDPLLCLPPGLPVSAGMALAEPPLLMLKSLQHRVTAASLAATLLRPWAPHAPQGLQGNSSLPILPLYPIHSKAQAWLLRRGCSDVAWLAWQPAPARTTPLQAWPSVLEQEVGNATL